MREPLQWSFPIGRLFGAAIRVHVILPVVLLGLYLKALKDLESVPEIAWSAAAVLAVGLVSILMHEFGHVFAARSVGGDSDEIVMWPLGGLAYCDLPPQPRAHFLTALAGPLVNLMLCVLSAAYLVGRMALPPLNPFTSTPFDLHLLDWSTGDAKLMTWHLTLAGQIFWINWALFWFNLLPAWPLDGGRMLHAILWARGDQREATGTTAYLGFGVMLILCVVAIYRESVLLLALAIFIYVNCRQQIVQAEGGEEGTSEFGASLRGDQDSAAARRPKLSFLQRWRQKRAAELAHREQEQRETEERRMDELLEKVQQNGIHSLTEEERRFMNRVSTRYRNNRS